MPALDALLDAAPRKQRRRIVLRPVRATVAFESELVALSRAAIRDMRTISRDDLISAAIFRRGFPTVFPVVG